MRILVLAVLVISVCLLKGSAGTSHSPVLVELFTSEGCSDCPPADALLAKLDSANDPADPQVIVLSEHVDYFNSPGWRDPFSSAAFTERQNNYAERFKLQAVYTPEMVVNGGAEFVGSDFRKAAARISAAAARPAPVLINLSQNKGTVTIEIPKVAAGSIAGSADVMLATALNEASSQVAGGENGGRRLHHVAVVRSLKSIGEIRDGLYFSKETGIGSKQRDLKVVAWVQQRGQGTVLGAAQLKLQ